MYIHVLTWRAYMYVSNKHTFFSSHLHVYTCTCTYQQATDTIVNETLTTLWEWLWALPHGISHGAEGSGLTCMHTADWEVQLGSQRQRQHQLQCTESRGIVEHEALFSSTNCHKCANHHGRFKHFLKSRKQLTTRWGRVSKPGELDTCMLEINSYSC